MEKNIIQIFTNFFFLGIGVTYLKGPRAALVLNPALTITYSNLQNIGVGFNSIIGIGLIF